MGAISEACKRLEDTVGKIMVEKEVIETKPNRNTKLIDLQLVLGITMPTTVLFGAWVGDRMDLLQTKAFLLSVGLEALVLSSVSYVLARRKIGRCYYLGYFTAVGCLAVGLTSLLGVIM